jgi:hypothetical protein
MKKTFLILAVAAAASAIGFAQSSSALEQLARGRQAWDQRLTNTAIAALQEATRDPRTAAEAHELLGHIYAFKGWQQDNVFPGFHDEPEYREKAIAELKASVKAEPQRFTARQALQVAEAYAQADQVEPSRPRPQIIQLDGRIEAGRKKDAPIDDLVAALDARFKAQADPAPYFAGALVLIDRGYYDNAIKIAEHGVPAAERFVQENRSAYQMEGKAEGVLMRNRAQAADIVGWALYMKKDYAGAAVKLEEAERLYRGGDFNNQFHLAEVARAQKQSDRAREHYLNALSLTAGPPPARERATQALTDLYAAGKHGKPFKEWLDAQLTARQDARKKADLKSRLDTPLPTLNLTTLDGKPYSTSSLQGKVLLLNFFASW